MTLHLTLIKERGLKDKLLTLLGDQEIQRGSADDIEGNRKFACYITEYFEEIFGTTINDKRYDVDDVEVFRYNNIFGNEFGEPSYELNIFGYSQPYAFYCDTRLNVKKLLIRRAEENEELFIYNPVYLAGFIKDEYKNQYRKEITYPEPDLDLDTDEEGNDIPIFDTDDCPVCMEKFGITEIQSLIGNHPTKKIIKTKRNIVIKRNTYCGHPICMECFKSICEGCNVSCPICRVDYEETGDVEITTTGVSLDIKDIEAMIEGGDDYLFEVVDIDAVVNQAIISDGYKHLLRCEGLEIDDDDEYWFCGLDRIENGLIQ